MTLAVLLDAVGEVAQAPVLDLGDVAAAFLDQAAQQASAQVQETPAATQTPPAAADPIGDLIDDQAAPTPAQ